MPESRSRKKAVYTPPPKADDPTAKRKPAKVGNPPWLVPTMVAMFVLGLLYIVVFYIAGADIAFMQALGNFVNVLIGFVFIGIGFALAMRWR